MLVMESTPLPSTASRFSHRKLFSVLVLIGVLAGSFASGFYAGRERGVAQALGSGTLNGKKTVAPPAHLSKDVDFALFWRVWDILQQQYVDRPVSETQLFYGALAGLVNGIGDPYTVFLDPTTKKKFDEELSGSFEGIGAEIGLRDGQIVVIAPLAGTPAERAGIKAGDMVLAIDAVDTASLNLDQAVSAIRGERGSSVTLTLFRTGQDKSFDVSIKRDTITVHSVVSEIKTAPGSNKADVGYIKIASFGEDTAYDFNEAVQKMIALPVRAIIIDLRNDPGGYLESSVAIASYWVKDGPVVIEQQHGDKRTEYPAEGSALLRGIPTVVLVNAGSASAAEILAGALQDYKLATIVGQTTFGKGSVQSLEELPDGSAIKITIAKWLTPNGRSINEEGIIPDVVVTTDPQKPTEGIDPELDKAFEILK